MEANPPLIEAGNHPPLIKAGKHPSPTRVENWPLQAEAGSKPPQGVQLSHPWNGKERAMADGGIHMKGPSGGLKGECLSPKALPTQLGLHRQDRRPSAKFTTVWMVKTRPQCNIASEAIWAYYTGIEPRTVKTWACQVLCMIFEYHVACVTRGSPVTSPILPGLIKDRLPPLMDYALPEDRSGVTDVRVWDHQARTLWVAVWLHRLDMALSEEPAASGSLVQARHSLGHLLAYFLAPRTAWGLQFEDVIDQVLRENRRHNERKCNELTSSL